MYSIGVCGNIRGEDYSYVTALENIGFSVVATEDQLDTDAIVIRADELSFGSVCEYIIKTKKINPFVCVSVVINQMNIEQRLALLQLGTHFLFDRNHVPEEVALIISNAFKLEKGKQKYENYKGAHQVKLEEDGLSVEIDGVSIMLTQIEYKYFELLYKKRNTVVVYQEIRETLWKDKEKTEFYANNITFLLRNKLRRAGFGHLIETIRSKGYRLRC